MQSKIKEGFEQIKRGSMSVIESLEIATCILFARNDADVDSL